jgi:hypothetical protein
MIPHVRLDILDFRFVEEIPDVREREQGKLRRVK